MTSATPRSSSLHAAAAPYLDFLETWLDTLGTVSCDAARTAVLVIDVIEGFCEHGNLASERVGTMVAPLRAFLTAYAGAGGTQVVLAEDAHPADAREFASFPPHCLAGTSEARTVAAIAGLEGASWRRFPKQTINGLAEPEVRAAVDQLLRDGTRDFVFTGDCTDLCIYHAAMALQLLLNRAEYRSYHHARVIVPTTVIETYDLSVEAAQQVGAQPHPGDLLHAVFLHHMALNGITVVRTVEWDSAS